MNNETKIISNLTFERKDLAKHLGVLSESRSYIDFLINGISLSKILGGVGDNIGKFGWNTNKSFEISEFNELYLGENSRMENGLFSIYVCSECGDEGCGTVMFKIEKSENLIKWSDFVWSDGFIESDDDPDDKIDVEPIVFDKQEYEIALNQLKKLIN